VRGDGGAVWQFVDREKVHHKRANTSRSCSFTIRKALQNQHLMLASPTIFKAVSYVSISPMYASALAVARASSIVTFSIHIQPSL